MEGFSLSATQVDYGSRPYSPKRQRDEEDGETSRVNKRRLSQEQWNFSNNTRNLNKDADQIITSLQNIEFENNEFILRLRITRQLAQVQETEVIRSRQNVGTQH